jgi:hypothetical protein
MSRVLRQLFGHQLEPHYEFIFDFTLESAAEQEANSDERVADNLVKWK